MTSSISRFLRLAGVVAALIVGLFASDKALVEPGSFVVTQAHAIIGRPLTPMSYAGVARRTTARAVTAGAVAAGAAAAAAAPVVVAPACVQAVDAYGRIYMRCP
ncbi:hypothetical protein [Bradyrhizobium sp. NP1]|uniref:hypothetical protein n=1 Tax=Bradyrhizobium sp. NP1 TaxID=3049772 RepID=UPI0025A54E1E|nr:hypothetical protein [Bradyrhizobium sp. NP1]WJR76792.1 hypothetical protein QOU61_29140 [Bradyrhizobium sp. NP1]